MHRLTSLLGMFLLAVIATAQEQPVVLTFAEALARARANAPAIVAARMRIEEARSHLAGASLRFPSNPTLEAAAGPRSGASGDSTDYHFEAAQELELPARRRARIDAARAGVAQEEQRASESEREVLRAVATAFLRTVEARERADAAESARKLADEALQIAQRRYAAGDVAQLDVNLARTAVARAEADQHIAAATLHGQLTQMRIVLGIPEPVRAGGSLRDALPVGQGDLLALAAQRSDVRLLDAELAEAEAQQRMAKTLRWPDVGLRASYNSEEGDRIALAGVGITLPVFHRGDAAAAEAAAKLARLRAERDALVRSIEAEVRGAIVARDAERAAAEEYRRTVMPLVEENERLALESYAVGQIGLADLLAVRREGLDARRAFIDQLIETRLAEVELAARAGVWK